ncbi:Gag-Uncharacterized protein [Trichinella sp. T8]|nr:Gag-Uncharacterized protein [Trichinella sp. T8]
MSDLASVAHCAGRPCCAVRPTQVERTLSSTASRPEESPGEAATPPLSPSTAGAMEPASGPWSSPIVMVRMKDSPRFCVDYRRLNAVTCVVAKPISRIDDTLDALAAGTCSSPPDDVSVDARQHVSRQWPLPQSDGFRYLLSAIDRFTRWPEAWPIHDITATTVVRTFLTNWIARFGVPSRVTTDRGRQFSSHTWTTLNKMLGCQHISASSYHPQANGIVERFHRHLKASLIAHTHSAGVNWTTALPLETNQVNGLLPPYSGPHRVLGMSDKVLTIHNEGIISNVAVDRTKPAFTTSDHAKSTAADPELKRVVFHLSSQKPPAF